MDNQRAVVLVSGGIDSATTLAHAQRQGFETFALTFDYGQRHRAEIQAAKRIADAAGVADHLILTIDPKAVAGSALTGAEPVPRWRASGVAAAIPPTYVPARNTIFLAHALAWCETLGARDIFIGANAIDGAGYPDCRPEFVAAVEVLANFATAQAVSGGRWLRVHAPLIDMTKSQVIEWGSSLGVNYTGTVSCYAPADAGEACGACDACILRRDGFAACGIPDPNERTTL